MVKCPSCKKEFDKYKKAWRYGQFRVEAYTCECGTDFRDYSIGGKHSFFLKKSKKGNRYTKV